MRTHDFIDRELGKAIPYGVYDIARNEGWGNVGIDQDPSDLGGGAWTGTMQSANQKGFEN